MTRMPLRRLLSCFLLALVAASLAHAQAPVPPNPRPAPEPLKPSPGSLPIEPAPLKLDDFAVTSQEATEDDYDATGMGSVEEQMKDEPFANDLIGSIDPGMDDSLSSDLSSEMAAVANTSPAERVAGEDRLNLRGFPTPTLRNGFINVGFPETLNIGRTIVIQGPLVPVFGRAAPGGIQDFMTVRPQAKARGRLETTATTEDRLRALFETTGVVIPKKLWRRLAVEWTRRLGPEEFVKESTLAVSTALTWRKNRTMSSMLTADFRQIDAQVTPGIPEYRPVGSTRIVGPYLPLAEFNANGPDAGVRRRSAVVGFQVDSQPSKNLALRAGIEGWWRDVEQDRFTTSVLALSTGLFEGIREPRHIEQPQQAIALQLEATGRYRLGNTDHKLLASASQTWGVYDREERALTTAGRNELPLSVRRFDPLNPDYYRPAYDPLVYSRILADRTEDARYTSMEASDRVAFKRGIWVLTGGLRYDAVDLRVEDRKPAAPFPSTEDTTQQLSYHAGVNYQVVRNRLLAFASASTAFDPSTRVDARTGRIQPNETTLGYEAGLKGRTADGKWEGNGALFLLYNQNISRRNPLYDDPIADAAQTQPQLVAAGEERYTGVRFDGRWVPTKPISVGLKLVYMDAETTASPALPWEVGKAITRLPALSSSLQVRYRSQDPAGGPTAGVSMQYVSNYVANYQDSVHAYLEYPDYALLSLSAGYVWKTKKRTIEMDAALRNALDRDLLASNARVGAGRELIVSARMYF